VGPAADRDAAARPYLSIGGSHRRDTVRVAAGDRATSTSALAVGYAVEQSPYNRGRSGARGRPDPRVGDTRRRPDRCIWFGGHSALKTSGYAEAVLHWWRVGGSIDDAFKNAVRAVRLVSPDLTFPQGDGEERQQHAQSSVAAPRAARCAARRCSIVPARSATTYFYPPLVSRNGEYSPCVRRR